MICKEDKVGCEILEVSLGWEGGPAGSVPRQYVLTPATKERKMWATHLLTFIARKVRRA